MKKNLLLLMVFLCMGVQLMYAPVADGSVGGADAPAAVAEAPGSFGEDPANPWFDDAGEDDPKAEALMRGQALKYGSQPLPARDGFGNFSKTNGKTQPAQPLSQGEGQSTVALTGPDSGGSASFNPTVQDASLSRGSGKSNVFTGLREWARRKWSNFFSGLWKGKSKPVEAVPDNDMNQPTKLNLIKELKELQENMRLKEIKPEEFNEKAKVLQDQLVKLINDPREKERIERLVAEQRKEAEQLKKAAVISAYKSNPRYELTSKEQRDSDIKAQVNRYKSELEAQIGRKGSTLKWEDINGLLKQRREELEKASPQALATRAREVRTRLGQRGGGLNQVEANLRELEAAAGRMNNGTLSQFGVMGDRPSEGPSRVEQFQMQQRQAAQRGVRYRY